MYFLIGGCFILAIINTFLYWEIAKKDRLIIQLRKMIK